MRKIAVLNQKGGVGKTTTVANTAAALAQDGQKVVVVDFDPQAHLTIHLGVEPESVDSGAYSVLTGSSSFVSAIMMVRSNLWILPANINLVGAESELVSVVGRETILREAIEKAEDEFDYMLIDCPPSLGLLTLNSLAAVDEILIPLQPHFLALQGFSKLLQTVDLVNKRINPRLEVKGVLLCMYDTRASLPSEVKADIESFLRSARDMNCAWSDAVILPVHIRRNIKLAEAPSYGKTIFEYEPNCHGAEDYRKVADFLQGKYQPESMTEAEVLESEPVETEVVEDEPTGHASVEFESIETKLSETDSFGGGPVEAASEEFEPVEAEPPETEPRQAEPAQVEPAENELVDDKSTGYAPAEFGSVETRPSETDSFGGGPVEAASEEFGPVEVDTPETESWRVEPSQVEPTETEPIYPIESDEYPKAAPIEIVEISPQISEPPAPDVSQTSTERISYEENFDQPMRND
jgi:chromosome partitioning protein